MLDLITRSQPVQHSRARPILLAFAARPASKLTIEPQHKDVAAPASAPTTLHSDHHPAALHHASWRQHQFNIDSNAEHLLHTRALSTTRLCCSQLEVFLLRGSEDGTKHPW